MLKNAAFMLQKETEKFVIAAAFEAAGKPQLLMMYSEDLVKAGKNAGADVREAAKLIMGGGGGQPGLATAGGKDVSGLAGALTSMIEAALLEFTGECDKQRLVYGVRKFRDELYVGDSIYSDGEDFGLDYYKMYLVNIYLNDCTAI